MKYLLKIVFWLLTLISKAFLTATTPIRTLAQKKKKKAGKLLFLGFGENLVPCDRAMCYSYR